MADQIAISALTGVVSAQLTDIFPVVQSGTTYKESLTQVRALFNLTPTSTLTLGGLNLSGATSGTISILPQAVAGTYNFNLPTTVGTTGQVLTSAGGGSSPMTWSTPITSAVTSGQGTANQVLVNGTSGSAQTGALTFTTPQDIGTSSNVQFGRVLATAGGNSSGASQVTSAVFGTAAGSVAGCLKLWSNSVAGNFGLIQCTDGNIHLDASSTGTHGVWLNFYSGVGGVYFGNGANGLSAFMNSSGSLILGDTTNPANKLEVIGSAQIGFSADTAAPSSGLIVSGQSGFGKSSLNTYDYVQIGPSMTTTNSNRGHMLAIDGGTLTYAFSSTNGRAFNIANGGGLVLATGAGSLSSLDFRGAFLDMASISKTGNGTFANVYGIVVSAFGTIGTNQYSGYFIAPTGGTVNQALYADNMAVGYSTTNPASGGLIVSGNCSFGASSPGSASFLFNGGTPQYTVQIGGATSNTSSNGSLICNLLIDQTIANTANCTNIFDVYINPTYSPATGTTVTNAVALRIDPVVEIGAGAVTNAFGAYIRAPTGGASVNQALYTDNAAVGFSAVTPPTLGMICSGIAGFGTSSPGAAAQFVVSSTLSQGMNLTGTQVTQDGGTNQYGFFGNMTFAPANSATLCVGWNVNPTFVAANTKTTTNAIGVLITPDPSTNVGTITNYYGITFNAGTGAGTITNATSGNFLAPGFGTNRTALFAADLSVNVAPSGTPTAGTIRTAPPSSNTVTTAFGTSVTFGTGKQNTTGYDILLNIVISVTVATTATIVFGVGSTSTPTTNTAISTFSITGDFTLSVYVPHNYYVLVDKTGTLTQTNTIVAMAV